MRRLTLLICLLASAVVVAGGIALVRWLPASGKPAVPQGTASTPPPNAALPPRYQAKRNHPARRAAAQQERQFDKAGLSRTVDTYMQGRPGRAGIMVIDLRTGQSYGSGQGGRFITASMIKVDILSALLLKRQREDRTLTGTERDLAAKMIKESDNKAGSALYERVGDRSGLASANRALGLRQTRPYPGAWGVSRTSPSDQVRLLQGLTYGKSPLSAANRRYVLDLMSAVNGDQRWGVSAAARPGERVAIKDGWVPLSQFGNGWAVNTMGRITGPDHDFLIAVCSQSHPTMGSGVETVEHLSNQVVTTMRQSR